MHKAVNRDQAPFRAELARKSIHIATSVSAILIAWFAPLSTARWILVTAAATALAIDLARLRSRLVGRAFRGIFRPMLRTTERGRLTGATTLAVGLAVTLLVFRQPIASVGMLHAALGDAASSIIGRRFGRHRYPWGKSLEGSAAFFLVAFAIGWALPQIGVEVAFTAAVATTLLEAAPLRAGDNLIIPLAGSAVAWAVSGFIS